MDKEKKIRAQRKGVITRHLTALLREQAEEDRDAVTKRLEELKLRFSEFTTSHDNILSLQEVEEEKEKDEQEYEKIQSAYTTGIKNARSWLKETNTPNKITSKDNDLSDLMTLMNIPKVEIDKFTGHPLEYHTFISIFEEIVDSKPIEDSLKLSRLIAYTEGPAKEAIRGCSIVGGAEGYKKAKEILKSRFGDDHLVSSEIINSLQNGDLVHSTRELQQLSDELHCAEVALRKINMTTEVNTQHSIKNILARCSQNIQEQWRSTALTIKHKEGHYPTFHDFVLFISMTSQDASDPVYGLHTREQRTVSEQLVSTAHTVCDNTQRPRERLDAEY